MNRIQELDCFRGLAALAVVLFHYTTRFRELYGHSFSNQWDIQFGHYGVQLFFIISGFVIFMTIEKAKKPMDFIFQRFTRLYPTYWVCLIISFAIISLAGLPGREVGIVDFVFNFTMVHKLLRKKSVDGAYWSLLVELLFYAFMFGIFISRQIKNMEWIGYGWLGLIVLNQFYKLKFLDLLLNLHWGMLFLAGVNFYFLQTGRGNWRNHLQILNCLVIAPFAMKDDRPDSLLYKAVITAIFFAVFYLFIYGKLQWIVSKPLLFLGAISYSFYLLHQNIGYIIILKLKAAGVEQAFILVLVPLLVSIGLAWIVTEFLEKPAMKALRSWYQGQSAKSVS